MTDLVSKCGVCGALLDEEDLFCAECGTEAPTRQDSAHSESRVSTHNFECQGCGASMSYDASAGSLRCPFCGSTDLAEQADAKTIAPQGVVPFVISRDQAVDHMRSWLSRGFWRPSDLSRQAAVVTMTAVYVPYWVFQARTHTYWTADSSQTPPGARSDWCPAFGEHQGDYSGVLIGASGALTPAETSAICPFALEQAVSPDKVDLDNVIVEQFSVARKFARPLARQGLQSLESQSCQQYVPGQCRNMKVNPRIIDLHSQPMLLPVWIMAYRYRDKVFRFLANGQSGRSTGDAPFSVPKAIAVAAAVAVIAIVLFGVLTSFMK